MELDVGVDFAEEFISCATEIIAASQTNVDKLAPQICFAPVPFPQVKMPNSLFGQANMLDQLLGISIHLSVLNEYFVSSLPSTLALTVVADMWTIINWPGLTCTSSTISNVISGTITKLIAETCFAYRAAYLGVWTLLIIVWIYTSIWPVTDDCFTGGCQEKNNLEEKPGRYHSPTEKI